MGNGALAAVAPGVPPALAGCSGSVQFTATLAGRSTRHVSRGSVLEDAPDPGDKPSGAEDDHLPWDTTVERGADGHQRRSIRGPNESHGVERSGKVQAALPSTAVDDDLLGAVAGHRHLLPETWAKAK